MTEVGFIIPSFCKNEENLKVCKFCIDSIRKFYPKNKIIIINDYSYIDIEKAFENYKNIDIVLSMNKGSGDTTTYNFFLENKPFDIAVIMNDSMFFENKIENLEKINTVMPLWHATNHICEWDDIKEPITEYNKKHNIISHSDWIVHHIEKYFKDTKFGDYALDLYNNHKNKWSGFFCLSTIINHNFLKKLNEKTNILQLLKDLNTNRSRRVSETMFPIACSYLLGDYVVENSVNGLFYSGPRHLGGNSHPPNILHGYPIPYKELKGFRYYAKGKYTSKISLNRRRN